MNRELNLINTNKIEERDYQLVSRKELKELRNYKSNMEFLINMMQIILAAAFYIGIGIWFAYIVLR